MADVTGKAFPALMRDLVLDNWAWRTAAIRAAASARAAMTPSELMRTEKSCMVMHIYPKCSGGFVDYSHGPEQVRD